MAAAAAMRGKDDKFFFRVEFSDELRNQAQSYQRVIDGAKKQAIRFFWRQAANCGLNGRKLTLLPAFIHHDYFRIEFQLRSDAFRVCSENHANDAYARVPS